MKLKKKKKETKSTQPAIASIIINLRCIYKKKPMCDGEKLNYI